MPAIGARLKDLLDETRLAMLITIQVAETAHMISRNSRCSSSTGYPLKGGYKHQSSENEHAHADETIGVRGSLAALRKS